MPNFPNAKQRYTGIFCHFTVHLTKNSRGLPRVSQLKLQTCLHFKMPKTVLRVYRNIFAVYGTFDEKSAIEGVLKAQQNHEGDTDTVTVYLFLAKICRLNFQNAKKRYTIYFPPVYGTFYDNKTKRGIPIYRLLSRYTACLLYTSPSPRD